MKVSTTPFWLSTKGCYSKAKPTSQFSDVMSYLESLPGLKTYDFAFWTYLASNGFLTLLEHSRKRPENIQLSLLLFYFHPELVDT